MPRPGDRVVIEGTKVGAGRREGTLVDVAGRMLRIRWDGGEETVMTPAPGSVRFLPSSASGAAAKTAGANAGRAGATRKTSPAKPSPKTRQSSRPSRATKPSSKSKAGKKR